MTLVRCAVLWGAGVVTLQAPARVPLAKFVESQVAVEIVLEQDDQGKARLVGTFAPLDSQFHLYSKDLPKHGMRGLGRPTLLEIVSSRAIKPAGQLVASTPTRDLFIRPLGMKLPVYPEGPVTLTLPISLTPDRSGVTRLSVTYMACSERLCLAPVIDKRFAVTIPARL